MKKGMNRLFVFSLIGLLMISFMASFVAADNHDVAAEVGEKAASGIMGFISGVVEGLRDPLTEFTANTTVFVRTLFFVLVFLIISSIMGFMPLFRDKKGTRILMSLIVTILAVYFIPVELIKPMLNPYTAMGVTFISIIPFILVFFFTRYMLVNKFLQKMVWMFFAVTLLAMTLYTSISVPLAEGVGSEAIYTWIYGIMSIFALVMVFFSSWIDRKIHIGALDAAMEGAEQRLHAKMALDKIELEKAAAEGIPTGRT